ncbi:MULTISPECIES: metallophosphoesterase [unclassified Myxococcus]|uniref:metallophosphoesterase n=1 Tax=unclassified Myxococcus TaxID=2648731 RepID=UPI00157A96E9|nr:MULTISPECIES: metallophosphoesterase [unclassified Myxococcus]NTX02158.1 metallophosphoesterase [Myxococcus sp. CA040A]NTX36954.1 metallophosphoesterase [Myxococcus sp. CA033]
MPFRIFSFSMLIGLGAVLGHLYLYRRLVRELVRGRAARFVALVVLGLLTLLLGMRRTVLDALPEGFERIATVTTYTWMGVALCLVIALGATDLLRALVGLGRHVQRRYAAPPPAPTATVPEAPPDVELRVDEERRKFLGRALAGGAALAGGGLATYGNWRAYAPPLVTELAVRIPKLPRALDGLTIVQLTDIHVGPFIQRRFMDELVRQANALKPDLFAITGDLVDGDVPTLGGAVAALGALRSRYGSYFVTGNHDYYSGDAEWTAFLQTLDIQSLRNRHVRIGDAGASLDLVGVDDWSGWRRRNQKGYDLDLALAGRAPDRAAVLLAHQPANFKVAAERGMDLQISGHTHGGQLLPMTLFIGLAWEHAAGLYRHQDSHIYVSRGCGFWGPPMRVGSPPELVKLVLTT